MNNKIRILAIIMMLTLLTACGKTNAVKESVVEENAVTYNDEYWKQENQMRLPLKVNTGKAKDETVYTESTYEIPDEQIASFKELNICISNFFQEKYGIDVSERLDKEEVKVFNTPIKNSFIGGYTKKGESCINLNELLFTDENFKVLLNSSYLHETMHYLGIISSLYQGGIDEGIAEHLAIQVAKYAGITYVPTESYFWYKMVADQLCVVNEKEIVQGYLTNEKFDIYTHISKAVRNVKQQYRKVKDPGKLLYNLLPALGNDTYGAKGYWMAFMAQDIINAYCKTFKPNEEEIEQMRKFYIVSDIETAEIIETDDGGYAFK